MKISSSKRQRQRSFSQFYTELHASSASKREKSTEDMRAHLEELNKEIALLQAEGLKEEELKVHIEKLHEYNRLKDVGQAVLGQLATLRGVRTQDVYKCYELNIND